VVKDDPACCAERKVGTAQSINCFLVVSARRTLDVDFFVFVFVFAKWSFDAGRFSPERREKDRSP